MSHTIMEHVISTWTDKHIESFQFRSKLRAKFGESHVHGLPEGELPCAIAWSRRCIPLLAVASAHVIASNGLDGNESNLDFQHRIAFEALVHHGYAPVGAYTHRMISYEAYNRTVKLRHIKGSALTSGNATDHCLAVRSSQCPHKAATRLGTLTMLRQVDADERDSDDLGAFADCTAVFPPAAGTGMPPQVTDRQLSEWIGAIIDRDERAMESFYNATSSRIFGIVKRIVRRTELAEEVVVDTYFQVWLQAVRFDPERGMARTWLVAIARSRAIDSLRHELRMRHRNLDEEAEENMADDVRPYDEQLDLARHQADLHLAMMLLGAQPRQLVALAFLRGFES